MALLKKPVNMQIAEIPVWGVSYKELIALGNAGHVNYIPVSTIDIIISYDGHSPNSSIPTSNFF